MEKRELGRTGERLSVIGFGGIVVKDETPDFASNVVAEAVDRGVNYFDVAPQYGDAEEKLGPALEPHRAGVFLACKTDKRTRDEARFELERSLRRLRTDHLDLYQLHAVTKMEDVETILGPGGALETFLTAREQGLVRFLGFSAHSQEAACALMDAFDFDSVLFPFNVVAWHQGGFGPKVLEKAQATGVARLALKALAKRKWRQGEEREWRKCWYRPVESYEEARRHIRFTLSLPITAAVSPGHAELFRWACDAADELQPLTEEDRNAIANLPAMEPVFAA